MTAALVWLGLLLGLRHALEADHLAAVASLASRGGRTREVARVAGAWGLGHAAVLFVAGAALVWTGTRWPPAVASALELAAGAVLVWLGVDVVRRALRRPRAVGDAAAARPGDGRGGASRALFVGGVHGIEGSGAVVLLVLPSVHSTAQALAYLGAFGLGSVAGMLLCSLLVTLPLGVAARRVRRGGRVLQLAVGAASLAVGLAAVARAVG